MPQGRKREAWQEAGNTAVLVVVLVLASAFVSCCTGAVTGSVIHETPGPIFTPPPDPVPFVYDGHVKQFGFWLNTSKETQAFTSFIHVYIDLDADPAEWASLIDPSDTRKIVWSVSPFYYTRTRRSANGYIYRDDFPAKWHAAAAIISSHVDRTLSVWLADEPDAVACGDELDTDGKPCGTPGDVDWNPNLYNSDLTRAAALIRADLPTVAIGYNLGGGALVHTTVADGVSVIGLEVYDDDWQAKLQTLETKTALPIWALTRAFVSGDPSVLDAPSAARLQTQWTWFQHDARVVAIFPFLACCTDVTTGTKNFYAGPDLRLTWQAQQDIGALVVNGTQTSRPTTYRDSRGPGSKAPRVFSVAAGRTARETRSGQDATESHAHERLVPRG